ncbi:hypothetical protein [Paenibacillus whitsoniae]|uniref:Uncharacterized protein n=1 Tax=Paenibacillus whitsoniae TaxID=2496558 RepID=A0A430JIH7_9BACL|nr:hypothetical protein [Paenibacillus whitsoniae]RTE10812.1 hypothetical protein EJQ19_05965 [Paenibacillus whitsoniae]
MTNPSILMLLIYAVIAIADWSRLKKLSRRDQIAYAGIFLLSCYLAVDYIWHLSLFFIEDAAQLLFGGWGRRLLDFLNVPPS